MAAAVVFVMDEQYTVFPSSQSDAGARVNGSAANPDAAIPTSAKPPAARDRYLVGSVSRAMRMVGMVADAPEGLTLTEISRELGMSKSAAHALARTLVAGGYLRTIAPGPQYRPGMELVRLGEAASGSIQLARLCHPVLLELTQLTGLTTRAAICDEGYPVFVDRVDAPGLVRFHTPLGVRELPHTSAAGKAILAALPAAASERIAAETGLPERTPNSIRGVADLLAELEDVRERGYAVDAEEDALGVMCVAATFSDHAGQVAGAVSATGLSGTLQARGVHTLAAEVRAAADRVSSLLGGGERRGAVR
jgi:IclR family transcriptional regulator, acetate operon repressor